MANLTETIYRVFGDENARKTIIQNVKAGQDLYEALNAVGYKKDFFPQPMRGEVLFVEDHEDCVDIISQDAWSEQRGFILGLYDVFGQDNIDIYFQCEEPGCGYYVSNAFDGENIGFYGNIVSDAFWEREYHKDWKELKEYLVKQLELHNKPFNGIGECSSEEELAEWVKQYNETAKDNEYISYYFFELVD